MQLKFLSLALKKSMHEHSWYEVVRTPSSFQASHVLIGISDGFLSSSSHSYSRQEGGGNGERRVCLLLFKDPSHEYHIMLLLISHWPALKCVVTPGFWEMRNIFKLPGNVPSSKLRPDYQRKKGWMGVRKPPAVSATYTNNCLHSGFILDPISSDRPSLISFAKPVPLPPVILCYVTVFSLCHSWVLEITLII